MYTYIALRPKNIWPKERQLLHVNLIIQHELLFFKSITKTIPLDEYILILILLYLNFDLWFLFFLNSISIFLNLMFVKQAIRDRRKYL